MTEALAPEPAEAANADVVDWLAAETHCSEYAARQEIRLFAAQQVAVDVVPTQNRVVTERLVGKSRAIQI
ncbi:MAG: hypothetical protein KDA52_19555, partial [Planctomycetaceae bacterium]|nr:hypothetical protein [Planctomycetaceae bacterium]